MKNRSFWGTILVAGSSGALALSALLLAITICARGVVFSGAQIFSMCVAVFPLGWFIGAVAGSAAALWNMDVKKPKFATLLALGISLGGAWLLSEIGGWLMRWVAH